MKNFIYKLLIFLIIPMVIIECLEVFPPPNIFTFRLQNALEFSSDIPHYLHVPPIGRFYPDWKMSMVEQGDLAHHTKNAVFRNNTWVTDKLGFRNNVYIPDPDVLIIGDSFIYGGGLDQSEILSSVLSSKLGGAIKVYNMAPCVFADYERLYAKGFIKKPKLIIFSSVERSNVAWSHYVAEKNGWLAQKMNKIKTGLYFSGFNTVLDRLLRFYSIEWASARLKNKTGYGTPSPVNPKLYFLQGTNANKLTEEDLQMNVRNIASCKAYCDSLHIDFLFLPMPNKESVYYRLVPFDKQPDYLFRMDSLLRGLGVSTINTLELYNNWKSANKDSSLYQLDDTHWNYTAVSLVAGGIIKKEKTTIAFQGKNR